MNEKTPEFVGLSEEEHNMFCLQMESRRHKIKTEHEMNVLAKAEVKDAYHMRKEVDTGMWVSKSFQLLDLKPEKLRNEYSPFAYNDAGYTINPDSTSRRLFRIYCFFKEPNKIGGAIYINKDSAPIDLMEVREYFSIMSCGPWSYFDDTFWVSHRKDSEILKTYF